MTTPEIIKLIPRNTAARRRGQKAESATRLVTGNPVSTRLESGVGNCFPGLECDLRNLERRFFPFLEVDISDNEVSIVAIDLTGVNQAATAGQLSKDIAAAYRSLAKDVNQGRTWKIEKMAGNFGPLGNHAVRIADLTTPSTGPNRLPTDAWTAIRLLVENSEVKLNIIRGKMKQELIGKRASYLNSTGSLAAMFEPGELTQSLCSPWTHDFRDCGCYYWASNHPDIAQPPTPNASDSDPKWNAPVAWERADRTMGNEPPPQANGRTPVEMVHYEINQKWQTLNFVIEGRETVRPYRPGTFVANPLSSKAELETYLRYAAGVELGVMHEYLSAAYSLIDPSTATGALRDDVTVVHAELMRITYGEMRHLRAVNNVLQALDATNFKPALQVAATLPAATGGGQRPVRPRTLDPEAVKDFIAIEQPSVSVDGIYARIFATLSQSGFGSDAERQMIRSIMAEGEDHYETFENIQVWLKPYQTTQYLRANLQIAPNTNAAHRTLQQRYRELLDHLYAGYGVGLPQGASDINAARSEMVGPSGIDDAAKAVTQAGFLVAFDPINDPRYQPVSAP
jgi:hypothetical protein